MNMNKQFRKQQGAALVVGLILLVVITVLAISGMNTATTELAMARNDQAYENVFQAAETGLETALGQGVWDPVAAMALVQNVSATKTINTVIQYEDYTAVPDKAFSLGVGSGIVAHHFQAVSRADLKMDAGSTTDRDSSATHTQAFYVVGAEPAAPF